MSEIIQSDAKEVSGVKILFINVLRTAERGLQIKLQSQERFWKLFRRDLNETVTIGRVKCYLPKQDELPGVPGYFAAQDTFDFEQHPNLNMLLAKDIEDGVTFDFGAYPISDKKIVSWIDMLKKQVKIIYLTYLKPRDVRVIVSSQTVEQEEHD